MKKFEVEEVLDDGVWTWRSFKLMKFEVEEIVRVVYNSRFLEQEDESELWSYKLVWFITVNLF